MTPSAVRVTLEAMAGCPKCRRELPANGRCFYCGSLDLGETKSRRPSTLAAWLSRLFKIAILVALVGGAVWLFTNDAAVAWIKRTLRLGESSDDPAAVRILKEKVPGVRELGKDRPGSVQFEVEEQKDGTVIVSVLHQRGDALTRATFSVDPDLKQVRALDAAAEKLANP